MKKNNLTKALLLMLGAVALVCVSVFSTIAYLSESAAVSNTFTVGNVSIEMFESPVNADGQIDPALKEAFQAATAYTKKTSDGNSYHLVPGKTFDKDPSVYVKADSEDCYIFIKVRNQIRPIEYGNNLSQGSTAPEGKKTMRQQVEAAGWKEIYKISADESIYVYKGTVDLTNGTTDNTDDDAFAGVVKKDTNERKIDLFKTFTVAEQADISKLGGAKVTITAFAIQGDINNSVAKSGTFKDMQRLWNVVSGEFEFENVVIPPEVINHTNDVVNSPDYAATVNN